MSKTLLNAKGSLTSRQNVTLPSRLPPAILQNSDRQPAEPLLSLCTDAC